MVQVRFISVADERPLGAIHWFAVHPTSMNLTNRLISSDNVGYAAILFENRMNNGALPGTVSYSSPNETSPIIELKSRVIVLTFNFISAKIFLNMHIKVRDNEKNGKKLW